MDRERAIIETAPERDEELSILGVVNVLLRRRRLLIFLPILVGALAAWSGMSQPRSYSASVTFLPEGAESGGASGIARQLGVDIGGQAGPSAQFYADLLEGREVLRQALESTYRIHSDEGGVREVKLIDLYEADGDSRSRLRAVDRLRDSFSTSVRRTGVVQVTVTAFDPALAEQLASRLVELLNEFNLERRQSQALEQRRFVAARMQEAQSELREAENALKTFLQQNRQFRNSPELLFEHDRLQRHVAMRQEIFTSLAQSHERARLDAVRDTPVITVIDHPEGSAHPVGRGTALRIVFGLVAGFVIAIFLALLLEFPRRSARKDGSEYREFSRLKNEIWTEIHNPIRIIVPKANGGGEAMKEDHPINR